MPNKRIQFRHTQLIGHRGARGEVTENTFAGFVYLQNLTKQVNRQTKIATRQANRLNIAGVEFDVQLTKDGELVVFHDDCLNRCTGHQGFIEQMTLNQLSHYRQKTLSGSNFDTFSKPQLNGTKTAKISTLASILPLLADYQHIELEVKTHQRTPHQKLACVLIEQLHQMPAHIQKNITLTTFDSRLLFYIQQSFTNKPAIKTGLLVENVSSAQSVLAIIHDAKRLGCVQVGLYHQMLTKAVINQCHQHGLKVTAWTVNDSDRVKELVDWQVDYIITDYPNILNG